MATATWIGTTNGDLNTAGNYSPSGVPIAGDVMIFPSTGAVRGPNASMADLTALNMAAIIVQAGFKFDIGSSGSPLTVSTDRLEVYGGKQVWFTDGGTSNTDEVFVATGHETTLVNLDGSLITSVTVASCVNCTIGTSIGNMVQLIVGGWGRSPNVTVKSNANTLTAMIIADGQVQSEIDVSRVTICGGSWRALGTKTVGTLNNVGGTAQYDSTGTITVLHAISGTTDLGLEAKTVTTSRVMPGANLKFSSSLVTFTNPLLDFRDNV